MKFKLIDSRISQLHSVCHRLEMCREVVGTKESLMKFDYEICINDIHNQSYALKR